MATSKTKRGPLALLEEIVASILNLEYDGVVARAHAKLLAIVRRQGRREVRMT